MKNRSDKLDKVADAMRWTNQRLASLEQDTRQPRLDMEADVPADEKTRERTEGAATAVQAMHGDSFSAKKVQDGPLSLTTFGVKAKPAALPCRDNVLVENGAKVVSLTLRDAYTKSRRWLTPHRQNLYRDEDHLRPVNYLVLPDQRNKFEDFNFIRLILQQFLPARCPLLPEGR